MIEDYEEVKEILSGSSVTIFNDKDKFNAVLWILDHMLLENATEEEVEEYLREYAEYTDDDFIHSPLYANILTRADIEVIQQLAIWHFTNNEDDVYKEEVLSPLYITMDVVEDGEYHGSIFNTDIEPPRTYLKQNGYAEMAEHFNYIDAFIGDSGDLRQTAAENLYKNLIEKGQAASNAAKANTNGLYSPNREVTVYLAGRGEAASQQPIVTVKERPKQADIALRKFISAVNGEKFTGTDKSREPEVDTTNFNKVIDGTLQQTAIYKHSKKPVQVKIGDTVTYTLRLYNEGEIDAYIKEVTDYLPPYLDYDDNCIDWRLSNGGAIATTIAENCEIVGAGGKLSFEGLTDEEKKLVNVRIPAAERDKEVENGPNSWIISYVDIEIPCKVNSNTQYEKLITNIAEVTSMEDKAGEKGTGNELEDRDSIANSKENGKKDPDPSNPFVIPEGEALESYKNSEIPNNETPKYYVPGQEDDDDFEKVYVRTPEIDLSLRKFISAIGEDELKETNPETEEEEYIREPKVISSGLEEGEETAIYNHTKRPVQAEIGNVVTYKIRVYNEGDLPGRVTQITDYVDKRLKYVPYGDDTNASWWEETEGTEYNKIVSKDDIVVVDVGGNLERSNIGKNLKDVIIPAYDKENDILSYVEVEVHCEIQEVESTIKLTNIAEITGEADENGRQVVEEDRDSKPNSETNRMKNPNKEFTIPDAEGLPSYKDEESEEPDYVPGQEDDDDFEKVLVVVPEVDLSLRKFISAIGENELKETNSETGEEEYIRAPKVDTTPLDTHNYTTAEYFHSKNPIMVEKGSIVTYRVRVYNEGEINAYVSEITDYLPNYLIYLEDNEINERYGWQYNASTRQVKTTITAPDDADGEEIYEDRQNGRLLLAYDRSGELDYIDVQIVCQVDEEALGNGILTNLAQITKMTKEDGRTTLVEDRDSKPDGDKREDKDFEIPTDSERPSYKDEATGEEGTKYYVPGQEDDDDFEKVLVKPDFDLALRKFITGVQNQPVNNRYPEVNYENGKLTYAHTKVPVEVVHNDIVTYTIRIFNEGEADGYANEITDDMPQGLEFLPDNQTNKAYRWKMLDENQEETEDVSKAKYIVTDYLSEGQEKETGRNNKIKAFDKTGEVTNTNPDYRDVKIAFKVTYAAKTKEESERIIVNVAQISADSDDDIDSVPRRDEVYEKDGDNEDDIDYDNVRVKYFDLSLLKWVAQTKVTLNGETVVSDTGHTAETSKNEAPVKIEIPSKDLNKIVIKYVYTIRITNEGEIEGYAEEIRDYIPEGLRFEEADNTEWNWKMQENGTVTTDYLAETLLKPGDSAEVPIVLTWINNQDNLGEKVNLAEISKDKNDSDSPDVDSIPDNKVPDEDDIDDAPVILAVKTGGPVMYIGLTMIILITFGSGVGLIKKYVLG